ncbi:MAG: zinc ribbon domain-containing protein [Phycisphaerae bacterium]|nr:zinc ribbon domain-containing protein [Phycisphaerae bacterium]
MRWLALVGMCAVNFVAVLALLPVISWIGMEVGNPWKLMGVMNRLAFDLALGGLPQAMTEIVSVLGFLWDSWRSAFDDPIRGEVFLFFVAVSALAPVALIAPTVGPLALAAGGRSMRASVLGAAAIAAGLTCGILVLASEALLLSATTTMNDSLDLGAAEPLRDVLAEPLAWLLLWLMLGLIWALALRSAGQARDPSLPTRAFRWLLAGTVVEVALAVTMLAWIKRRDNCICAWGSYWVLVLGILVVLLLCGPAIVLLVTRKARMQWARRACPQCGYPRRSGSPVCTECGHALHGSGLQDG